MGFLKKALGKSVGGKLLGKAIKKDPIASKLIKKDPLGSKLVGMGSSAKKPAGGVMGAMKKKMMGTGGNMPPDRATPAVKKMSKLGTAGRRFGRPTP